MYIVKSLSNVHTYHDAHRRLVHMVLSLTQPATFYLFSDRCPSQIEVGNRMISVENMYNFELNVEHPHFDVLT